MQQGQHIVDWLNGAHDARLERVAGLAQNAALAQVGHRVHTDVATEALYDKFKTTWQDLSPAVSVGLKDVEVYEQAGHEPILEDAHCIGVLDTFNLWISRAEFADLKVAQAQAVAAISAGTTLPTGIVDVENAYDGKAETHDLKLTIGIRSLPLVSQATPAALVFPDAFVGLPNEYQMSVRQTVQRQWSIVVIGDDAAYSVGQAIRHRLLGRQTASDQGQLTFQTADHLPGNAFGQSIVKYRYDDWTYYDSVEGDG